MQWCIWVLGRVCVGRGASFLHYLYNKESLSSLPLQWGLTFFIIFTTRTHFLHYLYNSDSLSSLPLQEGLAFFITFTTWMGHFQNFELGAQCIKVDGPIDAVVDIQLVDVEVGESHAQGVVGEHSHEDPVQDLGNVLHAQWWDPHNEHRQHGEQACKPAWHRHCYWSQFICTHPHQHSMANTLNSVYPHSPTPTWHSTYAVSEFSLSTPTHTNTSSKSLANGKRINWFV